MFQISLRRSKWIISAVFCAWGVLGVSIPSESLAQDGLHRKSKKFWKEYTPKSYARKLTQDVIAEFPQYNYTQCITDLSTDPKAFSAVYHKAFKPLSDHMNELTAALSEEAHRLKAKKNSRELAAYWKWLGKTSHALSKLGNNMSQHSVLLAPALEAHFDSSEDTYDRSIFGEEKKIFDQSFPRFFHTKDDGEKWEREQLENGELFLPNLSALKRQVEYVSSSSYAGMVTERLRREAIVSLCTRISSDRVREYANAHDFILPF